MKHITPENKPINFGSYFRVIITNASGEVVLVTRKYTSKRSAEKRAERETATPSYPALFATLLEYSDSEV